jgi:iron complex outermembrane receptor protein
MTGAGSRVDGSHDPILGLAAPSGCTGSTASLPPSARRPSSSPTDTTRLAAYLFEQSVPDPLGVELGVRLENQDTRSSDPALPDRDFDTLSAAAGLVVRLMDGGQPAPTCRGPSALRPRRSSTRTDPCRHVRVRDRRSNLEARLGKASTRTIRADRGRYDGSLSAFASRYADFVYLRDTGLVQDGLAVMRYTQDDAEFYGFELHGHVELVHIADSHFHIGLTYDQVRATLRASGEPLPRIPPSSALLALVYLTERWDARIEGRWVDEQQRVADNEQPTPSFTMLDASVGYKIFTGHRDARSCCCAAPT